MPTRKRADPYAACSFRVEIDGIMAAGFAEVSGLSTETAVIDYRSGDDRVNVRKLPGLHKYANLILKRGFTTDTSLWKWRQDVIDGKDYRRNGVIVLRDEAGKDILRWAFYDGWPAKLEGPTLRAKSNEIAIETLEIVHEGLELVSP